MLSDFPSKNCPDCHAANVQALDALSIEAHLQQLGERWALTPNRDAISASFQFKNYWETTAFVQAVTFIAHREDHHPDITFGYNSAQIRYSTHSVGGITESDFWCALLIEQLLA